MMKRDEDKNEWLMMNQKTKQMECSCKNKEDFKRKGGRGNINGYGR